MTSTFFAQVTQFKKNCIICLQDEYVVNVVAPELNEEEVPKAVEPILQEYLDHGDSAEVVVRAWLGCP